MLLALCLAGCAESPFQFQKDVAEETFIARENSLSQIHAWTLRGRLAIQTQNEGWTVTIHWNQDDDQFNMRLIAPLGQGTYELEGDRNNVSLLTADNKLLFADDPERLMLDSLGWKVPLNGLKYWIRGLPEPDIELENLVRDGFGRITDLQQSGWRVSILRYIEVDGLELPEKIFMHNDRFKLRLVIQDWKTST